MSISNKDISSCYHLRHSSFIIAVSVKIQKKTSSLIWRRKELSFASDCSKMLTLAPSISAVREWMSTFWPITFRHLRALCSVAQTDNSCLYKDVQISSHVTSGHIMFELFTMLIISVTPEIHCNLSGNATRPVSVSGWWSVCEIFTSPQMLVLHSGHFPLLQDFCFRGRGMCRQFSSPIGWPERLTQVTFRRLKPFPQETEH